MPRCCQYFSIAFYDDLLESVHNFLSYWDGFSDLKASLFPVYH